MREAVSGTGTNQRFFVSTAEGNVFDNCRWAFLGHDGSTDGGVCGEASDTWACAVTNIPHGKSGVMYSQSERLSVMDGRLMGELSMLSVVKGIVEGTVYRKSYNDDVDLERFHFKQGKQDGSDLIWFANGDVIRNESRDGVCIGPKIGWNHARGEVSICGGFRNGEPYGPCLVLDKSGRIVLFRLILDDEILTEDQRPTFTPSAIPKL
jgi:hypothetical protein